uniref:Uncharacterized protein n=1 Tax=Anguilla anguilla TaxID=7936 RepID=A0A0E9PGK4_ANGAN
MAYLSLSSDFIKAKQTCNCTPCVSSI